MTCIRIVMYELHPLDLYVNNPFSFNSIFIFLLICSDKILSEFVFHSYAYLEVRQTPEDAFPK